MNNLVSLIFRCIDFIGDIDGSTLLIPITSRLLGCAAIETITGA
jgi:hypothetical protein